MLNMAHPATMQFVKQAASRVVLRVFTEEDLNSLTISTILALLPQLQPMNNHITLGLGGNRHLILYVLHGMLCLWIFYLFPPANVVCDITGTLFTSIWQGPCFLLSIWKSKKKIICLDGICYMLTEEISLPIVLHYLFKSC